MFKCGVLVWNITICKDTSWCLFVHPNGFLVHLHNVWEITKALQAILFDKFRFEMLNYIENK